MKDIVVNDFSDLHNAVEQFGKRVIVYRGEREIDRPLRPKIGRYTKLHSSDILKEEKTILRLFQERSFPTWIFIRPLVGSGLLSHSIMAHQRDSWIGRGIRS